MRQLLSTSCWLLVSSCATSADVPTILSQRVDTTMQREMLATRQLTGKVKFNGPVTIQIGGTNNTATSTAIAKAKAPVAAAPHAAATATITKAGVPWWVYAGLALLGAAGGWVLRSKLPFPF